MLFCPARRKLDAAITSQVSISLIINSPPDLNPVEEVFWKLKYLLKYKYRELVWQNLEYALLRAVGDVTAADMFGYYKHVGYFIWEIEL